MDAKVSESKALSTYDNYLLCRELIKGTSFTEIEKKLGIPRERISFLSKKMKVRRNYKIQYSGLSQEIKQGVITEYNKRRNVSDISRTFELDRRHVEKILKDADLYVFQRNTNEVSEMELTQLIHDYVEEKETIEKLSTKYNFSRKSIVKLLKKADVYKKRQRLSIQDVPKEMQKQICEDYLKNNSVLKLQKKYSLPYELNQKILKANDIKIRDNHVCHRKYVFDETVFSTLTEESAYWLGFIYADGYLARINNTNSYILQIGLQESDIEQLEKFRRFLKSDKKVRYDKYNNAVRITFFSKQIFDDICGYGITHTKTRGVKLADSLLYNRHFWRGVIDGDGTVGFSSHENKDGAGKPYEVIRLAGNDDIRMYFRQFVASIDPKLKSCDYERLGTAGSTVYCANSRSIMNYLYEGCNISLDRKQKIYEFIESMNVDHNTRLQYNQDVSVFEEINDFTAYWCGYFIKKASMLHKPGSNCYMISVTSQVNGHLKKLADYIKCNKPIQMSKERERIIIFSKDLYKTLNRYGIEKQKKSICNVNPVLLQSNHFWHGVLDGSGKIILSNVDVEKKGTKSKACPSITIDLMVNQYLCNEFKKYIAATLTECKVNIYQTPTNIYHVVVEENADLLGKLLFKNPKIGTSVNLECYQRYVDSLKLYQTC